ncbi:hypothetical protein D3C78_1353460 [compost metagenome]
MTSEPFCATWLPSTLRSAACSRCVAEWLRAVARRLCRSMVACTVSPILRLPLARRPVWPNTADLIFWVSLTSNRAPTPPAAEISPMSPTWPPPSA